MIILAGVWYFFISTEEVIEQTTHQEAANIEPVDVGHFFMIGHWTNTPTEVTASLIETYGFGGVVIMDAPDDYLLLSDWITQWNSVSDTPLLIAIDQEGGPVTRLKHSDFIQTGQRDIINTEQAFSVGQVRGQELANLGITMNFAPVLDIAYDSESFMYSRTFASSTHIGTLAAAMIAGMKSADIVAVPKHFPGHDDNELDSHYVLPAIDIEETELDEFTLAFKNLFDITQPQALMTAHVLFPNIDDLPVTLSEYFLTTYLRDSLEYQNVIITDDMSMDAIDQEWSTATASVMALGAGADIVLFAAEPHKASEAYQAVYDAMQADPEFEEKLRQSMQRIQKLRE